MGRLCTYLGESPGFLRSTGSCLEARRPGDPGQMLAQNPLDLRDCHRMMERSVAGRNDEFGFRRGQVRARVGNLAIGAVR